MKKIGIIAAIIIAIILIVVGLVLLFKKYVRENISDGPGMVNETYGFKKIKNMNVEYGTLMSVRYSSSGDMNGNIDSTDLKRQEDGSYIIETRFKQYYFEPMQCKEYSVSQESVNELESIIKEYNLIYWDKIDAEDLYILDGPQSSLDFVYDESVNGGSKYKSYGFSIDKEFAEEESKIIKEFKDKLLSLINNENLIREYTESE